MIQARKYKKILFVPKDGGIAFMRKENGVLVMIGRGGDTHKTQMGFSTLMSSSLYISVSTYDDLRSALKKFIDE